MKNIVNWANSNFDTIMASVIASIIFAILCWLVVRVKGDHKAKDDSSKNSINVNNSSDINIKLNNQNSGNNSKNIYDSKEEN